jgi:hypothetical protein
VTTSIAHDAIYDGNGMSQMLLGCIHYQTHHKHLLFLNFVEEITQLQERLNRLQELHNELQE